VNHLFLRGFKNQTKTYKCTGTCIYSILRFFIHYHTIMCFSKYVIRDNYSNTMKNKIDFSHWIPLKADSIFKQTTKKRKVL